MAVEAVSNVVDNPQTDIVIEIARAEIHKAAKREDGYHEKWNIKKRALILSGENVIHDALDKKWQHPVSGAKTDHAEQAQGKIGPDVGFQIF